MSNLINDYNTPSFSDIFESAEDFVADYKASGLYTEETVDNKTVLINSISDKSATTLFYLLYSRYGNNHIEMFDTNRFKYAVFSIIFQYGPTWERRLELQDKLRKIDEDELRLGTKAIHNHANNPSTTPTTATLEELEYIDDQNTTTYKKSKLEAYAMLADLLKADVTGDFLSKFKKLFIKVNSPQRALFYVTEGEDNDD